MKNYNYIPQKGKKNVSIQEPFNLEKNNQKIPLYIKFVLRTIIMNIIVND